MASLYTHLPTIEKLIEEYEKNGLEKLIEHYSKYEWLNGSSESIRFLEEKNEEFKRKVTQVGEGGSLLNC